MSQKRGKKKNKAVAVSKKLGDAKPEQYFILITGVPLKNIKELINSFETMNEWVFRHHVNEARNDFANWIKDVFNEKELSEEVKDVRDMHEMQLRMLKYLINKYV